MSLNPNPNAIIAYTDGACKNNPGKGGWGVYLLFSDGSTQELFAGEAQTTNNRMELTAAIKAIEHTSHFDLKLELWTDSSYVKQGITTWIHGWKKKNWRKADGKPVLNQDLWQQLDAVCVDRNIEWHWIKGHAGHAGNEKADELANLGVLQPAGNIKSNIQENTEANINNTNSSDDVSSNNQLINNTINEVKKN